MARGIVIIFLGIMSVLSPVFSHQYHYSDSTHNEENRYNLNIQYQEHEIWLPYMRIVTTLFDQKNILWYKTPTENTFHNSIVDSAEHPLESGCCEEEYAFFYNDVTHIGLVNVSEVMPSSAITSAVTKTFNLDLPIFKPIMLPWDYYLKDYDVYLDYKFTLGNDLQSYLIKQIDIRVFYLFK